MDTKESENTLLIYLKERMKKMAYIMALIFSIMLPFSNATVTADDININKPLESEFEYRDNYLLEYIGQLETIPDKAGEALEILNKIYPSWEDNYKIHKFDCSEMSAYVSYYLDVCGIKNKIISGYDKESDTAHSWVEVLSEEETIIIESTSLEISEDIKYYEKFSERHTTDYYNETQWDWWNSIYFKYEYRDADRDILNLLVKELGKSSLGGD